MGIENANQQRTRARNRANSLGWVGIGPITAWILPDFTKPTGHNLQEGVPNYQLGSPREKEKWNGKRLSGPKITNSLE